MTNFPWTLWLILLGLGTIGMISIVPYLLSLDIPQKPGQKPLPRPVMMALGLLQSLVLMAIAAGVGLLAAKPMGLRLPLLENLAAGEPLGSWPGLLPALVGGLLASALIAALERWLFARRVSDKLTAPEKLPGWKQGLLSALYGGINEEILMRLFMVSGLAWLLGRVWQGSGIYWAAIVLAALLFGAGHLPATAGITRLTGWVVARALLLNGIAGVIFGWLYWRFGLESAMLAHAVGDIVIHAVIPQIAKAVSSKQPSAAAASSEPALTEQSN